jgi:hypothetical protein
MPSLSIKVLGILHPVVVQVWRSTADSGAAASSLALCGLFGPHTSKHGLVLAQLVHLWKHLFCGSELMLSPFSFPVRLIPPTGKLRKVEQDPSLPLWF